jgi:hypothetical protein
MSYCTPSNLRSYVAGGAYEARIPDDDPATILLIERAELDLDAEAFVLLPRRPGDRKVDVLTLDPEELEGLAAATCAQVVYRLEMGDEFFVRAQRQSVSTRAVSHVGKLPTIGPQTERELAAASLWRLTTSARGRGAGCDPDRWQSE